MRVCLGVCAVALTVFFSATTSRADDFYKGRQVTMLVGNNPGTAYDASARLVARYFGRYIPGQPTIVVQNMPGATGLIAANYVAKIAPKDGSVIANAHESLPLRQLLGEAAVQYDATTFQWIGSPEVTNQTIAVWHTAPIESLEDIKTHEIIMGGTTPHADSSIVLELANRFVGTRFKVVLGYQANQIDLAIERGELQGRAVIWNGLKATKPDWLRDHKVKIVAQLGLKRSPELPEVPLLQEAAPDENSKLIIQLYSAQLSLGRPIYAGGGVPHERVVMLRKAFDDMVASQEFLDEAKRIHYEVKPISGEELEDAVRKIMTTPPDLAVKAGLSQSE